MPSNSKSAPQPHEFEQGSRDKKCLSFFFSKVWKFKISNTFSTVKESATCCYKSMIFTLDKTRNYGVVGWWPSSCLIIRANKKGTRRLPPLLHFSFPHQHHQKCPLIREIQWLLRFWHASTRLWFDFSYCNSFLIIRSPGFIALSLSIFDCTSLQRQTWLNSFQTIFWHSFLICSVMSYHPFGLDFRVLKT